MRQSGAHSPGADRRAVTAVWAWLLTRTLLVAGLLAAGPGSDGIMGLTHRWVSDLLSGASPYHPDGVAYPPLAMFSFVLPGIGSAPLNLYRFTFPVLILVFDFAGLMLCLRAEAAGYRSAAIAYVLAVPAIGPILLLWRYDLAPAVLGLAALVALIHGRRRTAWSCLGIGIALKPYLAVVVPIWLAWEIRSRGRRLQELSRYALLLVLPSVLAAAVAIPMWGLSFLPSYTFQLNRSPTVDSTPSVLLVEFTQHAMRQAATTDARCYCNVYAGAVPTSARVLTSSLALLGLLFLCLGVAWRPRLGNLISASAAAVILLLLTSFVYSPQYVTWAVPPLALLAGTWRGRAALGLVAAAAVSEFLAYPGLWSEVVSYAPAGRLLLLTRTVVLMGAFLLLAWPKDDGLPATGLAGTPA